jgi:hypothetical protein
MTTVNYNTISGESRIRQAEIELGKNAWPEFIQHDRVVVKNWPRLYSDFSDFQFAAISGNDILGVGNSVPINWVGEFNNLPAGGLDWAMAKAVDDHMTGLTPNLLIGVQILLYPDLRNRGLSYDFLECMKRIARNCGFEHIALPLRPIFKHLYPLIPMEEYIVWTNQKGEPFDPWIRVHMKAGGKIISVCPESMTIQGKINEWQDWTGLSFQNSGLYIIEKALSPVYIDLEEDLGEYIESNVWIIHSTQSIVT